MAIPEATSILLPTFVALCLGALVGLERQVAEGESGGEKDFPGVRTMAFTALLGALAVLVSRELGPWLGVALFLASVAFLVLRYRHDVAQSADTGYTTEIASLCTFAVGVLAQTDQLLVATVVTIAMVALLRSKRGLHRAGDLLSPSDMEILIRFLVITGIVLPLLPDEPIDPFFGVVRPRDVWRMVVLISGVSFVGYALMRLGVGQTGRALTGMLAGLVSSTAAAFAYGRAARGRRDSRPYETLVVFAVATSFLRVGVMLAIVGPALLGRVALPLLAMSATGLGLGALRHRQPRAVGESPSFENPLTLRLALTFAAIYAVVLMLVAAVRESFGSGAIYGVSALAALPGADAPSLSLARLIRDGRLDLETATVAVVIVAVATTLTKLGIVAVVGPRALAQRIAPTLLAVAAVGVAFAVWLA